MNANYELHLKMIGNDLAQLHTRCERAFVMADERVDEDFIIGVQAVFGDIMKDIREYLKPLGT